MMKCDLIGCKSITDCLSAPNGAVCLCNLGAMTRLCQSDINSPSTWGMFQLNLLPFFLEKKRSIATILVFKLLLLFLKTAVLDITFFFISEAIVF